MEISSFSGKNSSSSSNAWELLESGAKAWDIMSDREQECVVRHYAPKVKYLASRLKIKLPKNVELGELISAGTLGLMESLGKFNPEMGIKFDTYAENRIRGAMLDELRRLDWFPRSLRQRVRQIEEAMKAVENEKGRTATEQELEEATGLDKAGVREGLVALQSQLCLNLDLIQDTVSADELSDADSQPFKKTASKEVLYQVSQLVEQLTPREKLVLSLYYSDDLNMREAAEVMGVTEGRISQLHSQALLKLRNNFYAAHGKDSGL
ncbi:MAG: FliA/WhiG family RNA polymerase sigma factor [Desulfovibrionales bacterium]|nr:FliA/WhiG family RNA polymerase sigma factor [Desulfovibrionales bacterium]